MLLYRVVVGYNDGDSKTYWFPLKSVALRFYKNNKWHKRIKVPETVVIGQGRSNQSLCEWLTAKGVR